MVPFFAGRWDQSISLLKIKISDEEMKRINIKKHDVLPEWNYTIFPS